MRRQMFTAWSEDDWADMNSEDIAPCEIKATPLELIVGERSAKPKKPAATKSVDMLKEKRAQRAQQEAELEEARKKADQQILEARAEDDKLWFWRHLERELLPVRITLAQLSPDEFYAANTDGQVCRVVCGPLDTIHPAIAAKEAAENIVLFFAQQTISRLKR